MSELGFPLPPQSFVVFVALVTVATVIHGDYPYEHGVMTMLLLLILGVAIDE